MLASKIICLLGNHGCGKSLISQLINSNQYSHNGSIVAITPNDELRNGYNIDIRFINNLILEYTFDEENFNKIELFDRTATEQEVYWIILDCSIDDILQRIQDRPIKSIMETRKALSYYQQRFRHLSAHFGLPFIGTTGKKLLQIYNEVMDVVEKHSEYYKQYRQMATQHLTRSLLEQYDVENILYHSIPSYDFNNVTNLPEYADEFNTVDKRRLYVRWYVNNHHATINTQSNRKICIGDYELILNSPIIKLIAEGESKKIYKDVSGNPYMRNLAFMVLKPTIYSQTIQATVEIENLNSVRACGSQLFLEMMWRNDIKHSYRSINSNGIIVGDFLEEVPPTEIIVKRYCQGTDKHSFYDILKNKKMIIQESNGEYICGPYVRFDWRNPNHISPKSHICLNDNPYYYIYERAVGKDTFFQKILTNECYSTAIGDKNITEDLLAHVMNTEQVKLSALKMFMTIQSYFTCVNLIIKDVCFMLDKDGKQFWSEINQDCMRIMSKDIDENQSKKDIWLHGGSASHRQIMEKWQLFNRTFIDYFMKNKFHETEIFDYNTLHYKQEIDQLLADNRLTIPDSLSKIWLKILGKSPRRILVTMDIFNGEPVLANSLRVYEPHSNGDYRQAMEKIDIFPDILLVDLNCTFGAKSKKNYDIINELTSKYGIHMSGGLRSWNDVEDMLKLGVHRCAIESGDDNLIVQIPKDRLIIEFNINKQNEVLIHGLSINTHVNIIKRIHELVGMGVNTISIKFAETKGHLSGIPRVQLRDLLLHVPNFIEKIYIAGEISTSDDLEYLWSFPRVIPQLGCTIWKDQITIGSIYSSLMRMDHRNHTIPAIIQDRNRLIKGLCEMNRDSIERTCQERILYYYSKTTGMTVMIDVESNHAQRVIKMTLDGNSNALLITVD